MKPSLQFNFLLHVFHLLLPLDHTCRAVPLVWSPNVAWHHRPRGPYPHWTCRFATFRWLFGQHEESRIGGNTHGSHSYTNIINNKKHMYISYTYVHRYHCAKNLESTCIFLWSGVLFLNTFLHLQLNPKNGWNRTQKRPRSATRLSVGFFQPWNRAFAPCALAWNQGFDISTAINSCRFPVSAKRKYHVESSRPRGIQGEANWPRHWGVYFWLFLTSWWFQPIWNMLVKLDPFPR